jgi:predicted N-acetyltransferase YhbS
MEVNMNLSAAPLADDEIVIRLEAPQDILAREALLDRAFGRERARKSSQRLREGRLPAEGLAFTAIREGVLVATLRLWSVKAGDVDALLLGPIAVSPALRSQGLGGRMIRLALDKARALGHGAVLLVGDAPYYQRFGFSRALTERLGMPGPVDPQRFLGLELRQGALAGASGVLRPTGRVAPTLPRRRAA